MGSSIISFVFTFNTLLVLAASHPWSPPAQLVNAKNISWCLARFHVSSTEIYSPTINKTVFNSVLSSTAQNLRGLKESIPKPIVIFRPKNEYEVPPAVRCAQMHNLNIRIRSGGHDYEGLSYISLIKNQQFMILDLFNLRHVTIDLRNLTAWVQSGATLGELYYKISLASKNLAFPAGLHTSLGLGGHLPGGAYGSMLREYGLGADNVIDVRMVDALGNVRSKVYGNMDDDLFWAICGGGGANFGIILAWKIRLVSIPSKVTMFTVVKTLEQNGMAILNKWQYVAPNTDSKLFIRAIIQLTTTNSLETMYQALYLGGVDDLVSVMKNNFKELGVSAAQCTEMSWIESVMVISGFNTSEVTPEYLLKGKPAFSLGYFKAKSDFVYKPMPMMAIQGMLKIFLENKVSPLIIFVPYGGMMNKVAVNATPFPHRDSIYNIQYVAHWYDPSAESQLKNEDWMRRLYAYMSKFVSSNPREAYVNYRDLDIGKKGGTGSNCSYPEIWIPKYFKSNLQRLVEVKGRVDPSNFFKNEQSIPPKLIRNQCTQVIP